jgi:hypothetical protein
MKSFTYERARSPEDAAADAARTPGASSLQAAPTSST